ncbi:hypothetical protein [Agathobaculum butyriciproducens]
MKYVVFDIDGTLIDSSKVDQWAMRTALAEFGALATLSRGRASSAYLSR